MKRGRLCSFIATLCTLRPALVPIIPTHLRDAVRTVTIRIWHRELFEEHTLHLRQRRRGKEKCGCCDLGMEHFRPRDACVPAYSLLTHATTASSFTTIASTDSSSSVPQVPVRRTPNTPRFAHLRRPTPQLRAALIPIILTSHTTCTTPHQSGPRKGLHIAGLGFYRV